MCKFGLLLTEQVLFLDIAVQADKTWYEAFSEQAPRVSSCFPLRYEHLQICMFPELTGKHVSTIPIKHRNYFHYSYYD